MITHIWLHEYTYMITHIWLSDYTYMIAHIWLYDYTYIITHIWLYDCTYMTHQKYPYMCQFFHIYEYTYMCFQKHIYVLAQRPYVCRHMIIYRRIWLSRIWFRCSYMIHIYVYADIWYTYMGTFSFVMRYEKLPTATDASIKGPSEFFLNVTWR